MDNKKIGHILFVISLIFIFLSFAIYVGFYRIAAYLIRDNVQKTLLWSNLIDRQLEIGNNQIAN